ncbi:uncharacterized protein A4U43_C06F18770 [Asparagus officinalis]|uniref:F-box domain-containing protein n=1 Tax=Asparagus officinalis TaxID=4686 RepID=A0A5P1EMS7_ASPOF|nr:F-box/kelch-repeat protein At1g30090 [Asparagus officinalis]ONK67305.1 uncharacterized protein A4U43_C06F18770 [Asparagus officinalis]
MMQRVRVSSHQSPVHKLGQSQMTLSPKFSLASSYSPSPEPNPSLELGPLMPGLPDDIALNCLLRLPIDTHPCCRSVCKLWRLFFSNKEHFLTHRKILGFRDPWLFTFAFHRCTGKIQWVVLDLVSLSWHSIPSMPCRDKVCPHGFGCIALPVNGSILVCGGLVSDFDCSLFLVLKYEVVRNKWSVSTRMLTPRSFFGSGLIDGRVYVAGGYSTEQFELSSAEMFDPEKGKWESIANMGVNIVCYDSIVLDGRLYVTEGWMWPFLASPIGKVYDPKGDVWEDMAVGMSEGWTGPSAVVHGRMFVVSEREGMRVKVYDTETDTWDLVMGLRVPERIRKPFSLSASEGRMYVVGRGLHVAIGFIARLDFDGGSSDDSGKKKDRFFVEWQYADVATPKEFSDLTPSSTQILFA